MNTSNHPFSPGRRTALSALRAASTSAALVACGGGGGGGAGPGSAGDAGAAGASYTLGAITGFGSVVMGGVRFGDSKASVGDEDGVAFGSGDLRLGMVVELEGGRVDRALGTAVVQRIRFGSEIVGPVGAVDSAASTVVVLGQTVRVTPSTVFDTSLAGGLSALVAGALVRCTASSTPAAAARRPHASSPIRRPPSTACEAWWPNSTPRSRPSRSPAS